VEKNDKISPEEFFRDILRVFEAARRDAKASPEYFYNLAGFSLRLRFAGNALAGLFTRAISHLETGPVTRPDLTVCLFDSVSTGARLPPPPWSKEDYLARSEIRGFNDAEVNTAFNLAFGSLNILSHKDNTAVYWIKDACRVPYYEAGSPLLTILHWWMRRQERQLVHGGAVGRADGGILFAGKGGSGKSTVALTSLLAGFSYAGDDYVLLNVKPPFFVHSLYNSAKLDPNHLKNFPGFLPCLSNPGKLDKEKGLLFLKERFSGQLTGGFPLKAVVLPHLTGLKETGFRRASAALGLRTIFPSTVVQLPGADHKDVRSLSEIIGQLPVYILELGTDLSLIPETITRLLSDAAK